MPRGLVLKSVTIQNIPAENRLQELALSLCMHENLAEHQFNGSE